MSSPFFSEVDKDFDQSKLSSQAQGVLRTSQDALNEEFTRDKEIAKILEGDGIIAGYKIEIRFGPKRTTGGPNLADITLWESGKRFDGGGDEQGYICSSVLEKSWESGCSGFIPAGAIRGELAFCPTCQKLINARNLTQGIRGRFTTENLAKLCGKWFRKLNCNADVYAKHSFDDIRYRAAEAKFGAEIARRNKALWIYPLNRLIKDSASGKSIEDCLMDFFTS